MRFLYFKQNARSQNNAQHKILSSPFFLLMPSITKTKTTKKQIIQTFVANNKDIDSNK